MLSVKSIPVTNLENIVDYFESLSSVEQYYDQQQEPPGYWVGGGAREIGLFGNINRGQLLKVLQGFNPVTDKALVSNAGIDHKPGWDCTFSAPKSVSATWAVADQNIRSKIESAHNKAVEYAAGYLEREAIVTRHGAGGAIKEPVLDSGGIIAVAFPHATSRSQDPMLHHHLILTNMTPNGRSIDLDTYHKMAAGALYRVELASQLKEIGFSIQRKEDSFDINGVPVKLLDEWSKRRIEILKELARTGNNSSKAAEIAALKTRSKKQSISRKELFEKWSVEAEAHDFSPETINALLENNKYELASENTYLSDEKIMNELMVGNSTVSALQILKETAVQCQGIMCAEDAEKYAVNLLNSENVIKLSQDHKHIGNDWIKNGDRFTTTETIELEKEMLSRVERMNLTINHTVSSNSIKFAKEKYSTISEEQELVLNKLTKTSGSVAVVQGLAGSGKSHLMGAAREAWENDGYQVIGTAISNQATKNLEEESLIESFNTTQLAIEIEKGNVVLNEKTVIVVDEAGMQSTHTAASLLKLAEEAGSKIVFVGDTRQLQAIDAGSPMRAIAEKIGYFELKEVRRQKDHVSKKIALLFREGRSQEALELLDERNQLHISNDMNMAKDKLAKAYLDDINNGKSALCVAATRAEVRDLNQSIRAHFKQDGKISREGYVVNTSTGYREFSAGDKIIFGERYSFNSQDNEDTNVWNGAVAKVQSIENLTEDSATLKVLLEHSNEVVTFNSNDMTKIDHGYASTVHKAQGASVDCCHVLACERAGREWTYVAGSRHRESVNFYTSTEYVSKLSMRMGKAQQKDMATDYTEVNDFDKANEKSSFKNTNEKTKDLGFSI